MHQGLDCDGSESCRCLNPKSAHYAKGMAAYSTARLMAGLCIARAHDAKRLAGYGQSVPCVRATGAVILYL